MRPNVREPIDPLPAAVLIALQMPMRLPRAVVVKHPPAPPGGHRLRLCLRLRFRFRFSCDL